MQGNNFIIFVHLSIPGLTISSNILFRHGNGLSKPIIGYITKNNNKIDSILNRRMKGVGLGMMLMCYGYTVCHVMIKSGNTVLMIDRI
jgi:hypothetical protein